MRASRSPLVFAASRRSQAFAFSCSINSDASRISLQRRGRNRNFAAPGVMSPHAKLDTPVRRRKAMPVELLGKSLGQLREWMVALGEPAYRGGQLYHALYAERRFDFAALSSLPLALRERLQQEAMISLPRIARRYAPAARSARFAMRLGEG